MSFDIIKRSTSRSRKEFLTDLESTTDNMANDTGTPENCSINLTSKFTS